MADHKDSPGSKASGSKAEEQDWDFNNLAPTVSNEVAEATTKPKITLGHTAKDHLVLDNSSVPRVKTRSAMAKEMLESGKQELKEEFQCASFFKRALAFMIDSMFLLTIAYEVKFSTLLWRKLIQYWMDGYKLKFDAPESVVLYRLIALNGLVTLFFLIIVPVYFFNTSLGKKILGLRIRGVEKFNLTMFQVIKRELLFKPLSVVIVAGFITPFISKNRLSLHDMLAGTIVVEDE